MVRLKVHAFFSLQNQRFLICFFTVKLLTSSYRFTMKRSSGIKKTYYLCCPSATHYIQAWDGLVGPDNHRSSGQLPLCHPLYLKRGMDLLDLITSALRTRNCPSATYLFSSVGGLSREIWGSWIDWIGLIMVCGWRLEDGGWTRVRIKH